jgi:cob(I)alamin adenosyltransferase
LVAGASNVSTAAARVQQDLFVLGAQLAATGGADVAGTNVALGLDDIRRLEKWIEQATAQVEPLSNFILPGGCELAARLHVARTVCRRAERAVVSLHRVRPTADEAIVYLNHLGDLLFAWARLANRQANCPDDPWRPGQTS